MCSERHLTMKKLHTQFTKCAFMAPVVLKVLLLQGKTSLSIIRSGLQMTWSRLSLRLRRNLFLLLNTFQYGMCFHLLKQAVRKMRTMLSNVILSVQFSYVPWLVRVKVTSWILWKKLSVVMRDGYTDMMRVSTPRNLMKHLRDR